MARLTPVKPEDASGKVKEQLDAVKQKLGKVPNIIRGLANSPVSLGAYLGISGATGGGKLSASLREQIALAVSEKNECDYCLAAHTAIGKSAKLGDEEIMNARHGKASDPMADAALKFAVKFVDLRGNVKDSDIQALRDAGFSDEEIAEIFTNIMQTIFTNYFNHLADTEVDFPKAEKLSPAGK